MENHLVPVRCVHNRGARVRAQQVRGIDWRDATVCMHAQSSLKFMPYVFKMPISRCSGVTVCACVHPTHVQHACPCSHCFVATYVYAQLLQYSLLVGSW